MSTTATKTEVKQVKHTFTMEERNAIGGDLARGLAGLRGIEAEFDQVKASYKAKTTEAEARIDKLTTDMMNGFEMRQAKCVVSYRPEDRKKDFILEEDWKDFGTDAHPVLTEDMTPADFDLELIEAESAFENRQEIEILPRVNNDGGILVVGQMAGKWFSALRVCIGNAQIEERLDSEQECTKKRQDAITRAAKRLKGWLVEKFGKDAAKGFDAHIDQAVDGQKERVE